LDALLGDISQVTPNQEIVKINIASLFTSVAMETHKVVPRFKTGFPRKRSSVAFNEAVIVAIIPYIVTIYTQAGKAIIPPNKIASCVKSTISTSIVSKVKPSPDAG
jgi:hypothetical protein